MWMSIQSRLGYNAMLKSLIKKNWANVFWKLFPFFMKHKVFWVGLRMCLSWKTDLAYRRREVWFSFPLEWLCWKFFQFQTSFFFFSTSIISGKVSMWGISCLSLPPDFLTITPTWYTGKGTFLKGWMNDASSHQQRCINIFSFEVL